MHCKNSLYTSKLHWHLLIAKVDLCSCLRFSSKSFFCFAASKAGHHHTMTPLYKVLASSFCFCSCSFFFIASCRRTLRAASIDHQIEHVKMPQYPLLCALLQLSSPLRHFFAAALHPWSHRKETLRPALVQLSSCPLPFSFCRLCDPQRNVIRIIIACQEMLTCEYSSRVPQSATIL